MTTPLPPFSGDRPTCAKCGHVGARTRYRHQLDPSDLIGHHLQGCTVADRNQERLCRDCQRCDHHWDEATAVAQPVVWTPYEANLWLEDAERILAAQGFAVRLGPHDRLTAVKFGTIKEQQ